MIAGSGASSVEAPPLLQSVPAWMRDSLLFVAVATVVFLAKLPTLDAPAYWDEMGYVAQGHFLSEGSLARALPGRRAHRAFWGHPPGLQLAHAVLAKAFGHSVVGAHLLIAVFALGGVWFTFLLGRELRDALTGVLAAALLFVSPLYFAQAGMFLADLPVAALGVASFYFGLRRRFAAYVVAAGYMVLIKETGVALIAAWVLYALVTDAPRTRAGIARFAVYLLPLTGLAAFLVLQKLATGHFVFQYTLEGEILRTDSSTIGTNLRLVTEWIFIQQLRWVFTAVIALALLFGRRPRDRRPVLLFMTVVLCYGYAFCFLYFLPRYLLPVLPFFFLLAAASLADLVRPVALRAPTGVALVAAAFLSLLTQPFVGNAEFNARYIDVVRAEAAMARWLSKNAADATVVTEWPHTRQLLDPALGYVRRPLAVVRLQDDPTLARAELAALSWPAGKPIEVVRARVVERGWHRVARWGTPHAGAEVYRRPPPGVSAGSGRRLRIRALHKLPGWS